jgi:hypothetical protein
MPAVLRNLTGRGGDDPPPVGPDFDGTPMRVGDIQIEATVLFRDAHVNRPPRRIELGLGFQPIKSRPERGWRWSAAGGFVMTAPEPRPESEAANRPGFTVPIDHEIGKGGAVGGVEQLRADCQFEEHGGRRCPGRPIRRLSGCDVRSEGWSGRICSVAVPRR